MKRKLIKILVKTCLLTTFVTSGLFIGGTPLKVQTNQLHKIKIQRKYIVKQQQNSKYVQGLAKTTKKSEPKNNSSTHSCNLTKIHKENYQKEVSQNDSSYNYQQFIKHKFYLSFYTSLSDENSNTGAGTDCRGNPLVYGDVADNYLPYGTKIHLKGLGTFTVRDVGSSAYFTNKYTLDVFIPRNENETNEQYYNRVNNMGRQVVEGYIVYKQ